MVATLTDQEIGGLTYQAAMKRIDELNVTAEQIVNGWSDGALPSKAQRDEVSDLNREIKKLEEHAKQFPEGDALRQEIAERRKRLNQPVDRIGFGTPGDQPSKAGYGQKSRTLQALREFGDTLGEIFTNHPTIADWAKQIMAYGSVGEKQHLQSPRLDLHGVNFKDLITGVSDTSAGALVRTQYEALVQLPFRPLTIADVITMGRTGTDLIEYPRVTGYTNAAAPVAEATAASGATGAKPESSLALEKVTTAVKTIAHWIPASKRAIADADQVRTLIDAFGIYGLEEEWEDQVVNGSGVGENLTGILNTTGTSTQAYDTSLIVTMRKARTVARVTGKARPNAILMHPNDWEDFDLLKDNEARYSYFGGPMELGTPRLWGLPVIESEAAVEGTAILGDFKQVVWWDRQQSSIQMTDSHSDFFIRNLVAILFERRGALGILRPAALVEVDLTP